MRYIALIGDIVASKKLSANERARLQERLEASTHALNRSRKRLRIASDFTITLGDEFQALFSRADHLWACLFTIERDLYPTELRFAIGVGDIVTAVKQRSAIGMDGPAFHEARAGIDVLREQEERYGIFGLRPEPPFLTDTLSLISKQRSTWKLPRVETFLDLLQGAKPQQTAERLGLSSQAIYKNLADGSLEPIHRILQASVTTLNGALEESGKAR